MKHLLIIILIGFSVACSKNEHKPHKSYAENIKEHLKKNKPKFGPDIYTKGRCSKDLISTYNEAYEVCQPGAESDDVVGCLEKLNNFLDQYSGFECYVVRDHAFWLLIDDREVVQARDFYQTVVDKRNLN